MRFFRRDNCGFDVDVIAENNVYNAHIIYTCAATLMFKHFTLHVRLTKRCNADCSYCSSYEDSAGNEMSLEQFYSSIDYLCDGIIAGMVGGRGHHISIQYLGGEVLTVDENHIRRCVEYAREKFSTIFDKVIDGAQTNLIGSERRVKSLYDLFSGRIGSSQDGYTDSRTVSGSASKYRTIFIKRIDEIEARSSAIPVVIVIDSNSISHIRKEVRDCFKRGRSATLRPVFDGGKSIHPADNAELASLYVDIFNEWFLKGRVSLQPFYQLLMSRLGEKYGDDNASYGNQGCPFQSRCAGVSLDLEPNGDIYICQDMADSKQHLLGNALSREFDAGAFNFLAARSSRLDSSCLSCRYLGSCQGGCMSEAISHTGSPYGKTYLCDVWKSLFLTIDSAIERADKDRIYRWLEIINAH